MAEENVRRFRSITGAEAEVAQFCLQERNGNVEEAVRMFYEAGSLAELRPAPIAQAAPPRPPGGVVHAVKGFVLGVVTSPYRVLRAAMEESLRDPDEKDVAQEFIRSFERHYGQRRPQFVEMGWKQATEMAEQESKFLLAYIHSPDHQDTEAFCQQVLASHEVVEFLTQNVVCWGGSINHAPASLLAAHTDATTFPYMCVLGHIGSQFAVMASLQGKVTGRNLIDTLHQCLAEQNSVLVTQRAERRQREVNRQIREDQDAEFQRALEADRERDRRNREAAAERAAAEQEARRKEEEQRRAEEAEKRRKEEQAEAIVRRRMEKRSMLGPETTQTEHTVQIRIRLPDGSVHTRKFLETDKIQEVYDFVDGLDSLHCWDYTLASSYPKIEFTVASRQKTLIDMGVEHSATLLVQSHDD